MRIFIDIGHPAHVHYFRNFINSMQMNGHLVFVTARNKEMTHSLLLAYGIEFCSRGKGSDSLLGKLFYLIYADLILLYYAILFKPEIFISFSSPYAAHVSKMLNKIHITFDDTEIATLGAILYRPFTDWILSPSSFSKDYGSKQIKFNSYMELCYLHPNYFKPDISIKKELGMKDDEKYCILRFVNWKANHDIGIEGISLENKISLVKELSKYCKVFISSESNLSAELIPYQLRIPYHRIHHAIYYASLVFGESATMASESAVLGTPAVYLDKNGRGYTYEEERKYGLVYNYKLNYHDQLLAIKKGIEILNSDKEIYLKRRVVLLKEKIDVTSFMIWFVETYPESLTTLTSDPDYLNRFN